MRLVLGYVLTFNPEQFLTLAFLIGLVHFRIFRYRPGTLICCPRTVIHINYLLAWVLFRS